MTSKHTPGPWFVGTQNDALYIIDQMPRPNNDYPQHDAEVAAIAKVYHSGVPGTEDANAHLIAAAPDLYEALKGLVGVSTDTSGDWSRQWNAALSALAKARGEHS